MEFDLPTLGIMAGLASMTAGIALLWVSQGHKVDGLFTWGIGLFSFAISLPLIAIQNTNIIPNNLSIIGGNVLMSTSVSIMLMAVWQFQNKTGNHWLTVSPIVATAILFTALLDNQQARFIWGGFVLASQCLLIFYTLWIERKRTVGRGQYLVMFMSILVALELIIRSLLMTIDFFDVVNDQIDLLMSLSFMNAMIVILMSAIGFISMTRERSDEINRMMALNDELTRIPNRRALMDTLEKRFAEARRYSSPLSILLIDIDKFKYVNDTYGHLAGDQVLIKLVSVLNTRLRTQDTLGRYGGEEFLVLLPNTGPDAALKVAEDLRIQVENNEIIYGESVIRITISTGIANSHQVGVNTTNDMIRAADAGLYKAKNLGRNRSESISVRDSGEALLSS